MKPKLTILSAHNCGNCRQVSFLLSSRFKEMAAKFDIEWIYREDEPERFDALAESVEARSIPFLVYEDLTGPILPGPKYLGDILTKIIERQ